MDSVEGWAAENGLTLFQDDRDPRIVAFYVSESDECFQIVIERLGDTYRIDAWSIETHDDEEAHQSLIVRAQDVSQSLDEILKRVRNWFLTRNWQT